MARRCSVLPVKSHRHTRTPAVVEKDTIAAIATPRGAGGIGIVRISGPSAESICRLLFKPKKNRTPMESHRLYYGECIAPASGAVIDEVLVTLMRAPHSYTGEDTLEIHCHGGPLILEAILGEAVRAGARSADSGEFTRRAFLNERLDLVRAEAVMDLIAAQTERGRELALSQFRGGISKVIEEYRSSLADILAEIEMSIDFNEEDGTADHGEGLVSGIDEVRSGIIDMLSTFREGSIQREGISVVIAGRPNVGKSSLLNRLVGQRRAIVTSTPGTTRDFIEEVVTIEGMPVKFIDTAGVREGGEEIEREGISFVWEKVAAADIVIVLTDGSAPLTEEDHDIIARCAGKTVILALNKSDLPAVVTPDELSRSVPGSDPLAISAKFGDGIPALKKKIYRVAAGAESAPAARCVITNLRHKIALEKTADALERACEGLRDGLSPELPAVDIREALENLAEIVGATTTEEILDRIFSRFCVGK
ncbi:MAG: tRNA uridine-5-carboxymethylaminomethyl(34) synthesis GTPase MnmE [Deltaproteobacteria bacterium]|nr:tRNA uridine-5-carboxymethylaminomethyl(34) synthesis GTPase MnmE [Deltaproteobacteria bacterium]